MRNTVPSADTSDASGSNRRSRSVKVLPCPDTLVTVSEPPRLSAICFATARPSPVP